MFEVKLNYFTDYELQDMYGLGVQILEPSKVYKSLKLYKQKEEGRLSSLGIGKFHNYYHYELDYKDAEITYFNTDDGVSFVATDTLEKRDEPYITSMENNPYAFDFEKETLMSKSEGISSTYFYLTSSFAYFLDKLYDSVTHITDGQGIYDHLKLEFTDVFNLYEYNSLTGKFDIQTAFGYIVDYLPLKVNYYERGAQKHEDSLFNQIGQKTAGGVIWGN